MDYISVKQRANWLSDLITREMKQFEEETGVKIDDIRIGRVDGRITSVGVDIYRSEPCQHLRCGRKIDIMSTLIDPWGKKEMQNLLRPVVGKCEHAEIGIDRDGGSGTPETTCRHNDNIPDGQGWGECSLAKCPLIRQENS